MKNTVHNDATSSNLKGKPMTKTIGLHWLQQVTKHVPATDEASVHRAQLTARKVSLMPNFLATSSWRREWYDGGIRCNVFWRKTEIISLVWMGPSKKLHVPMLPLTYAGHSQNFGNGLWVESVLIVSRMVSHCTGSYVDTYVEYLFMSPGHSQNFGYGSWANWYPSFSRVVSHPTEFAHM